MKKKIFPVAVFSTLLTFSVFISANNTVEKSAYSNNKSHIDTTIQVNEKDSLNLLTGKKTYNKLCSKCHKKSGKGVVGIFPPLAKSDYLLENKNRAIQQVLHGVDSHIVVNKITYRGIMPAHKSKLNNQEIADVLNYVLHAWGNNGELVSITEVEKFR